MCLGRCPLFGPQKQQAPWGQIQGKFSLEKATLFKFILAHIDLFFILLFLMTHDMGPVHGTIPVPFLCL